MTVTADPFAQTTGDLDLDFSDPTTEYTTIDDIDGRLVCIFPKEIRTQVGNDGNPYDKVVADVIVLDGPVTDKVTEVPMFIADMHLSAGAVVGAIRGNVRTGKPVLCRVDSRPSTKNKRVLAYGLQKVAQDVKESAAPVVRSVLAANTF